MRLTRRESQLLDALLAGKRNKPIAFELGISENTVKVYLSRLYQKLGAADRLDLVAKVRTDQSMRSHFLASAVSSRPTTEGQKFCAIARTLALSADELREALTILIGRCAG